MSEIKQYEKYLQEQEKSKTTVRKYVGETAKMMNWLGDREITKGALLGYKKYLAMNCSSRRVNSAISAINNFLEFKNLQGLKIKTMKIQKNVYRKFDRELGRGLVKFALLICRKSRQFCKFTKQCINTN